MAILHLFQDTSGRSIVALNCGGVMREGHYYGNGRRQLNDLRRNRYLTQGLVHRTRLARDLAQLKRALAQHAP